ncbi:MAG TPA: AAA family ATPase, partial [Candidatus Lokiarchaeia archaeon]
MAKKEIKIDSDIPWVEKYRPKSIKEMALPTAKLKGHRVNLTEQLIDFIKKFFEEVKKINEENKNIRISNRNASESELKEEIKIVPEKTAILLEGPPGVGKTSIVYALANDLNMEVVETNASDTRTREALENKLKETTKSKGIMDFITQSKQKIILIDEIDGIYGVNDRGAVPAILNLIQNTQFPIIMCSNEYKQSLQPLYNLINKFDVNPLSDSEVMKITRNILKKEEIKNLKEEDLNLIVKKNNGDLRGIINDIQGVSQGSDDADNKDLILNLRRDSVEEIFTLIRDLFQKVSTLREARDLADKSDVDYNFLYKWINENIPNFIKINSELSSAYKNLSLANEIFGRIRREQYWELLPYFYNLFTREVVLSSKKKET